MMCSSCYRALHPSDSLQNNEVRAEVLQTGSDLSCSSICTRASPLNSSGAYCNVQVCFRDIDARESSHGTHNLLLPGRPSVA